MAFEKTKGRYASFGVATSLPPEIIDTFWYIIDKNLKGVFPLDNLIMLSLVKNKKNELSIEYNNKKLNHRIVFDFRYPYDPYFPRNVYIIDNKGVETILLSHEIN